MRNRSAPISNLTFPTSTETITSVRFNLSESSVLASIGSDRTFTLYDIRTGKAERRVIMQVPYSQNALGRMRF
jgi:WD repeat and SOF domain-containing protein 1